MRSPLSITVDVIRGNLGPLGLAVALLLLADVHRFATLDPEFAGLTWGGVLRMVLTIAAGTLATLAGCWASFSGTRPGGFVALRAFPRERIAPFAGYAVLFYLWFFALSAIMIKLGATLIGGDMSVKSVLILAAIHTVVLIVMYLQLGIAFPDTVITGESGIILAMALGFVLARKILSAIWLPALLLTFPQAALAWLIFDAATLATLAASFPAIGVGYWLAAAALASMSTAATVFYAVALTQIFLHASPTGRFNSAMWQ